MSDDILQRAYEVHARACMKYPLRWPWMKGVARPFGTPDTMPPHRWRVSRDVMLSLVAAIPPYMVSDIAPNPKSSHGLERRLFGWPIDIDSDAPNGTIELLEEVA